MIQVSPPLVLARYLLTRWLHMQPGVVPKYIQGTSAAWNLLVKSVQCREIYLIVLSGAFAQSLEPVGPDVSRPPPIYRPRPTPTNFPNAPLSASSRDHVGIERRSPKISSCDARTSTAIQRTQVIQVIQTSVD